MLALALVATDATATNNSVFVSQNVPATMALGQTYQVSVTMLNTGDTTWSPGGLYRLGAQAPQDNTTWGTARIELPNPVAPGQSVTFNFAATAPSAVGTYNFQWRMVQDMVEWFGDYSDSVAVKDGDNDAVVVSQNVPSTMVPGQSYPVSITVQNTGNTTWIAANQYRLGAQNPQDNATWGFARVELPNDVSPGVTVTFNFTVTAPPTVGTYDFQWQMVEDLVEWFGQPSSDVAVRDGVNNAVFVSQDTPSSMVPGQTYAINVTMQNTGTTTWTSANNYGLGSQNPQDNTNWGLARVELPNDIAPGQSVTFSFSVTAPSTIGTYDFQWQMVQDYVEWFGVPTDDVSIQDGSNNAAFVSQSAPSLMVPGQSYPVSVTMQNTGTTTWTSDGLYRLGSQNPQDNATWGLSRVELPNDVPPGASVTFNFTVTAPSQLGTYDFQWKMVQDNVEWFGDYTTDISVIDGVNSAVFVSQQVPNVMVPGQDYLVNVTMTNTGNTTWTSANQYRLGAQNPQDNTTWGLNRVELPSDVPPGSTVTFTFAVIAPTTPGTYNLQWQMVEDAVAWFGSTSDNIVVKDGINDAAFVSQIVPPSMAAGQPYLVSVTMQNVGTTTWTAASQYRLGSQNPQDNTTWGLGRIELPRDVPPGRTETFTFAVTAPAAIGTYDFQWRMVQELVEWFGQPSNDAVVTTSTASGGSGSLAVELDGVDDGQTLYEGTRVAISVSANGDPNGIASIFLLVDGALVAGDDTGYSYLYAPWGPLTVGTHAVTARATGVSGTTGQTTKTVIVTIDPLDVPIRAVLENFKTALASGDKATAMTLLSSRAQGVYSSVIDTLMPNMPQIVASWSDPRRMSMDDFAAEYAVTRMSNGVLKVYIFSFVIDQNGQWVIDSM
jgi:alkylated DNA repair dioxygenase AlkB